MRSVIVTATTAILVSAPAWAVDLPSDTGERAVVCSVYGAFARAGDPRDDAAKRAIQATIDAAVSSGGMNEAQVRETFNETTEVAINQEPRAELTANWAECRDSFAP